MTDKDATSAAETANETPAAAVEMAQEAPAAVAAEAAPTTEPAAAASGGEVAPAKTAEGEHAKAAPVEVPAYDWTPLAGEDADALKLLADFKTPADLIAEIKKAKGDWREELANGDEKTLTWLKRFTDKASMMKSVNGLRSKVGDNTLIKMPNAKSTPEEWAEFRKALGVPEDVNGYKLNLPEDADQSDLAKAARENFLAVMHKAGATQDMVDAALKADMARAQMVEKYVAAELKKIREANEDELRGDWGAEYRDNLEAANRYFRDTMDEFGGAEFLDLELKSGARIRDYLPIVRWAAQQGRDRYGAGAFQDGSPMDAMSLDQEWSKYMGMVGTADYDKPHVQKRVQELARIRNRQAQNGAPRAA